MTEGERYLPALEDAEEQLRAGAPLAIYIGDHLADEDAFLGLSGQSTGIVVRGRATVADCSLQNQEESFLVWLSERSETAL